MFRDPAQRTLFVILVLNLTVAVAKGVYGYWSGSLAVASDAVHSVVDAAANVVGLVALRFAAEPPDAAHPYGHKKLESIASAMVGVAIGAGAARFGWVALLGLLYGREAPRVADAGIAMLVATLVVNVFVAAYEARRGRELNSSFLIADAAHTASDVVVTVAVIASQFAAKAGIARADSVAALGVLILVAGVAWRILSSNVGELIDRAVIDEDVLRTIALSVSGVHDCHRVRSRGTSQAVHVDLHVTAPADMPLSAAHALSHRVEDALRAAHPTIVDLTIHVEPEGDPPEPI